ncbi:methionyl-tRNA formyltransferase [Mycoplasma bradburyae]|uniref:methionyl-tRNA formyltransferase n=1 Tax=Mycoplasma bradburyae TaxID=2963128 RepID=A0AAW6HRX9_9MOLU|nr:methionyl-tRNA formyltransferase [Mycoplasma bradburyae]MDC4183641.1 methionyl-tRNA formyltransferase [Mycoplasma bradburyae]UTS70963.1 methionyl-tRNA formyltransferase [Mycoplasma bradburyae]
MIKKRVAFFGTTELSLVCLKAMLNDNSFDVVAIISPPDRVDLRNKKNKLNSVKQFCIDNNLQIYQPEKLSDFYEELINMNLDLGVCIAYGQFIPKKVLNLFKDGIINVHPSKLPLLRGGAPIHYAIINGFKSTAISIMKLDEKMDHGPVYDQLEVAIKEEWNHDDLNSEIIAKSPGFLIKTIKNIYEKNLTAKEQDHDQYTLGLNIKKEQEHLNLNLDANSFVNWQKGLWSTPGGYLIYDGYRVKIAQAKVVENEQDNQIDLIGSIYKIDKTGIYVYLKRGSIAITKYLLPSKKVADIKQSINGNIPFKINTKFE